MNFSAAKILITEDNDICNDVLYLFLKKLGYQYIDRAKDWRQTFKLFADNLYNIIFLDIGLPVVSGLSICKAFRYLETGYVPIVAITGYISNEQIIKECHEAGFDKVLGKPYYIDDIKNTLKEFKLYNQEV